MLSAILPTLFFAQAPDILWAKMDNPDQVSHQENKREILSKVYSLQMPFIENEGQIADEGIRYYTKTIGGTVCVTKEGEIVYSLLKSGKQNSIERWVIKESFVESNSPNVTGQEVATTKVNYFNGKEPSNWRRNISTYTIVSVGEIYDGIELLLKAYGTNVEKIFVVMPGAVPERIKVKVEGAKLLGTNENGALEYETNLGIVRFTKPLAYQETKEGERKSLPADYVIFDENCYGFRIANYDNNLPLIIDPLLASTFIGEIGADDVQTLDIDASGNVYIGGCSNSLDFPTTPGTYDSTINGSTDGFICKLDGNLSTLLASTFIGGSGYDMLRLLDIDASGNVYVAGYSQSPDFPTTPGAYDSTINGNMDGFICKLDGNLGTLLASTFIGGNDVDEAWELHVDPYGYINVSGTTSSSDFPITPGAYDDDYDGGGDIFVSKLEGNLSTLLASTYIGGYENDWIRALDIDAFGDVYVAGHTWSNDYPISSNAYDSVYNGGEDIFISKLNGDFSTLLASTFIGGSGWESAWHLDAHSSEHVYMTGYSESPEFPATPGAYDESFNSWRDIVVCKLDCDLSTLLASTFIGGGGFDDASSLCIDTSGNIYVTGLTTSPDYPTTPGAYDAYHNGACDVCISKFDGNLCVLLASTFIGGCYDDVPYALSTNAFGNVYVSGITWSSCYPIIPGSYCTNYHGWGDGFVSKLDSELTGIEEIQLADPEIHSLETFPNPFSDKVNIRFHVVSNSRVDVKIYDTNGSLVKSYNREPHYRDHGSLITWDGTDQSGRRLGSGVYFLKLQLGDYTTTEKLLLIK
jgi:hypothetical protein